MPETSPAGFRDGPKMPSWRRIRALQGHLGVPFAPPGHFRARLGPSSAILQPSWAGHLGALGLSWAALGPSQGPLGAVLGLPGEPLGAAIGVLLTFFGCSEDPLESPCAEKPRKPNIMQNL